MMATLNEDCMHHINAYLKPNDWIHTSEVCQMWDLVAKKNWKTITEINFMGKDCREKDEAIIISDEEVRKIVRYAAPFVKVLTLSSAGAADNYIKIGLHCYKVRNLTSDSILKLLADEATGITEVYFISPQKIRLVESLFSNNKIKKLRVDHCFYGWYVNIPTHGIEDFELIISEDGSFEGIESIEGRFPNLKKLTLHILEYPYLDIAETLSKILPHIRGIKSLDLLIIPEFITEGDNTLLSHVTQLSQLEELSIELLNYTFRHPELFLNQLPECCPRLRALKIMGCINVNDESLQLLLSLPQLESFECGLTDFPFIELPEQHLSEMCFTIYCEKPQFAGFFVAVKKMRQLKSLSMDFFDKVDQQELLHLVCGVATAAASVEKDVLVTHLHESESSKKLRISNSNAGEIFDEDIQLLKLSFEYENEETLFKDVEVFVRNKLCGYRTFILENKQKS